MNLAEESIESEVLDARRQSEKLLQPTAQFAPVMFRSAHGGMSVKSAVAARRGLTSATGLPSAKTSSRHMMQRLANTSNATPKRLEIVIGK